MLDNLFSKLMKIFNDVKKIIIIIFIIICYLVIKEELM